MKHIKIKTINQRYSSDAFCIRFKKIVQVSKNVSLQIWKKLNDKLVIDHFGTISSV